MTYQHFLHKKFEQQLNYPSPMVQLMVVRIQGIYLHHFVVDL